MAATDGTEPFLLQAARGPNTRFMLIVPRGKEGTPPPRGNGPADTDTD
jgi:hypothetical protein